MILTANDVARFLDQPDPETVALAEEHLPVVTAFVRAYTRGNGFTPDGGVADDIGAVILTCAARLVSNPAQHKREELGDYSVAPTPFAGFTLAEALVLNQYRVRTR